jgi:hypothetical protein
MKNIFIFALLAILCMVNAIPHQLHKRNTQFGPCPGLPDPQPSPLSVTISPDPVIPGETANFTVTGTLSTPITPDFKLLIGFGDSSGPIAPPFIANITIGTTVNVVENVPVPKNLDVTSFYAILVCIYNPTVTPPLITGCTFAEVGDTPFVYPVLAFPF